MNRRAFAHGAAHFILKTRSPTGLRVAYSRALAHGAAYCIFGERSPTGLRIESARPRGCALCIRNALAHGAAHYILESTRPWTNRRPEPRRMIRATRCTAWSPGNAKNAAGRTRPPARVHGRSRGTVTSTRRKFARPKILPWSTSSARCWPRCACSSPWRDGRGRQRRPTVCRWVGGGERQPHILLLRVEPDPCPPTGRRRPEICGPLQQSSSGVPVVVSRLGRPRLPGRHHRSA